MSETKTSSRTPITAEGVAELDAVYAKIKASVRDRRVKSKRDEKPDAEIDRPNRME